MRGIVPVSVVVGTGSSRGDGESSDRIPRHRELFLDGDPFSWGRGTFAANGVGRLAFLGEIFSMSEMNLTYRAQNLRIDEFVSISA
jgi:hypothetical protein